MRGDRPVLASAAASTKGDRMSGVRSRVAVVTGAAHGLGREIALMLAREGARVALGDTDGAGLEQTVAAITSAGGVAVSVAGDLTDEHGAAGLIDAAVERSAEHTSELQSRGQLVCRLLL